MGPIGERPRRGLIRGSAARHSARWVPGARPTGDEFAILLQHADRKAAELVAEDVVTRVAEDVGMQLDAGEAVTVSVGGVVIERLHGTPSDLL